MLQSPNSTERKVAPCDIQHRLSNEISTTKYTWYNFVPKNVYEQLHNLSNVYFLVLSILQTVPAISITKNIPTILPALMFVMGATAVKDIAEDMKRGGSDKHENASLTRKLDCRHQKEALEIPWSAVKPGMILRVKEGDRLPADCLLLDSSDPEGSCLVETADLDGETNLKRKVTIPDSGDEEWWLCCEGPSSALYEFRGMLVRPGKPEHGVGVNSLLLRGTTLRNTEWVECMVVYCGIETRIMMNSRRARFKQSRLDMVMNRLMICVFLGQVCICLMAGSLYSFWTIKYKQATWYLAFHDVDQSPNPISKFFSVLFLSAGSWELQLGNMVPISLIVCQMMVKLTQAFFIQEDIMIKDVETGKATTVQTSQVLENLGQITHVFSDKTGTLTCNVMEFRACSVATKLYGWDVGSGSLIARSPLSPKVPYYGLNDVQFLRDVGQQPTLARFVLGLACCHTVSLKAPKKGADEKPQLKPGGSRKFPTWGPTSAKAMASIANPTSDDSKKVPEYEASSPDELAMVSAAYALGLEFLGRSRGLDRLRITKSDSALAAALRASFSLTINSGTDMVQALELEILDICEFDNDRKRMSIVVRTAPNAKPLLIVKGADSSVLPYVKSSAEDNTVLDATTQHLQTFSCAGLRTLVFAERELGDAYADWHQRHEAALASLALDRSVQLAILAKEIEEGVGLKLLGATAIEDRLQDQVPDVIESLRKAGIIVWVLTGDKLETALNIGLSCRLLSADMMCYELDHEKVEDIKADLARVVKDPNNIQKALAITGSTLAKILEPGTDNLSDRDLRYDFFHATQCCASVLCCRVSPKQKADIVKLVQDLDADSVSLSIGDGANDVNMITTADVGVGLTGKEGTQAARSADFQMCQFKFLKELLFKHGRESCRRNSVLVAYNFYKNAVLCGVAILYGEYMNFSGQSMYDGMLYQLYNVIYSTFPIIFFSVFDRPCNDLRELAKNPEKWYPPGRKGEFFNMSLRLRWMLLSVVHAYLVHKFTWKSLEDFGVCGEYTVGDLWSSGAGAFAFVIFGVNICLLMQHTSHLIPTVVVMLLSMASYPITMQIASNLPLCRGLFGSVGYLFGFNCGRFWLSFIAFVAALCISTSFFLNCPIFQIANADVAPAEQIWANMIGLLQRCGFPHLGGPKFEKRGSARSSLIEMQNVAKTHSSPPIFRPGADPPGEADSSSNTWPERPEKRSSITEMRARASMTSFSGECMRTYRENAQMSQAFSNKTSDTGSSIEMPRRLSKWQ